MSFLFNKSGILTTIQDLGRFGFQRFGINPNGAMDRSAMRIINILLGNNEDEAVIETHFPAPEILIEKKVIFAIGGANFSAELNGKPIDNWRVISAEDGSLLKFKARKSGSRAYISVKNGFKVKSWLESASTNLKAGIGGFDGRAIKTNDRIYFKENFKKNFKTPNLRVSNSLIPLYSRFPTLRITAGAEFENLTALSEQDFLKKDFVISASSDRMGFRLKGEPLFRLSKKEMLSTAVKFGTIQLLPDGQLIILMADHQTTGGYPRIGHIIKNDLPILAQLGANDKLGFHLVSIKEAEDLQIKLEKDLSLLKIGCKFAG